MSNLEQSAPRADEPDSFDDRLALSVPPTVVPDDFDTFLVPMVAEARLDARRTTPPRALRRVAGVGAVVLLGLGGVGAAAASTWGGWEPWWTDDANGAFTYTLPSGAVCEEQLGNIQGIDPAADEAIRSWFDETDVVAQAEVEAEIQRMRADTTVAVLEDGTEVDASYGTDYYFPADEEYRMAMNVAVADLMTAELARLGFEAESYDGAASCPGAQW
ncbi:hypothetical protein [Sanguibacter sp. 25GB23B1]|uniref:hypothetical protein n=1 Tax=unclassified Sanguibacter TaxID=2645534 RepID=UPI0032AF1533